MLFHEKDSGSRKDEANKSAEQWKIRLQANVEEFPDLVAIMEYEFWGEHRERGGGRLESHSKLCNKLLYRVSDSKTKMNDARQAILALAPDDFTTSLSSCFNYTQNFLKDILEARRHREERGVLLASPFIRLQIPQSSKTIINIRWTSSKVNYVLDKASKDQNNYCVNQGRPGFLGIRYTGAF